MVQEHLLHGSTKIICSLLSYVCWWFSWLLPCHYFCVWLPSQCKLVMFLSLCHWIYTSEFDHWNPVLLAACWASSFDFLGIWSTIVFDKSCLRNWVWLGRSITMIMNLSQLLRTSHEHFQGYGLLSCRQFMIHQRLSDYSSDCHHCPCICRNWVIHLTLRWWISWIC